MTIYLDVILLENLCMNYIILFATGMVNKLNLKQIRILLSSLLGAIYAVVSFLDILPIYLSLVVKILISICMIYLAFHPKNIKTMLKELIIFYLTSFVFGGVAFFLLYYIKPQDILMKNGVLIGSYPIKIAILGGIVGFVIVNIAFHLIKGKFSKKDLFCEIEIYHQQKSVTVKALIDSRESFKRSNLWVLCHCSRIKQFRKYLSQNSFSKSIKYYKWKNRRKSRRKNS